MLESVMLVAAGTATPPTPTGPRDESLRLARTCYDHIAGRLGVGLADAMVAERWIELDEDAGVITPAGLRHLANLGIDLDPSPARKARAVPLCRPCLDWSERRLHVAGRLGAALCTHGQDRGWIRKLAGSRALDAIAPSIIRCVSQRHPRAIARVPRVFRHADLLRGRFCGERRKWRPIHFQFLYVRAKKDRDRSPPGSVSSRLCNKEIMRASRVSLHGRKRGWRQQLAADVLDELAILLRLGDYRDPFGIGEKSAPALLALGHAVPGEHVDDLLAALADQRGPKPGLADAVLLPDP